MAVSANFSDYSVLIIEDSALLRGLLRNIMISFKFNSVTATPTAEDALRWLQNNTPDIILTDWLLDGMAGVDFTRHIRMEMKDPIRRLPIIMCTAYTDRDRILIARDNGVNEILAKPITGSRTYDAFANALEKPREFIDMPTYVGPDRRRRQISIGFPDRRGIRKAQASSASTYID
ncbi:MAG: response regulator [Pseudomonadota bacterium]